MKYLTLTFAFLALLSATPAQAGASPVEERALAMLEQAGATLNTWVQAGADFASAAAPELAREVVTYGIVSHTVKSVFGALLLLLGQLTIWKFSLGQILIGFEISAERGDRYHNDEEVGPYFRGWASGAVGAGASLIGVTMLLGHSLLLAKALVAPRLYLLEAVARFL